ncbi:MAG: hypothetical protein A2821_00705 [Candidatus Magasanikbacteria bacterium RIFCSPHIGHO2_01_FULL_41_23]|uniref:AAA+ ATPase domain-containing protein n=1 Tax=Candidatus Magasanikbacteria bacterium RIFCSPLOWO2_01_FULL_40_15 TaxID=1798686 RepID=A0A1F6N0V9_9BACT|nr:MAG: hypothetical protein A2821_00705 [Candidatus Magasanikbacteria bacterium RIFCSPHIGHO2_01_FULL_41_23]OGH74694.1 MAG: hypothetical protein A3F22_02060 [Candidatus Magasanikbacteria bacterium RIFCSPHIGHO2_12_FULL_41_16]OGH77408.1 MAG: hypothetical protein A2983_01760 [Candidatus Magasanikbacteria bacterium RIFCSPLOWO2_01_FULL_40_15]
MPTKQELDLKNPWWNNDRHIIEESDFPTRDLFSILEDNLEHTLILNIVGLRRVGKSTLLKQLIAKLLAKKTKPTHIFYFLFDYASQIQKTEFLDEVLSLYFKDVIHNPSLSFGQGEQIYIFLDEIQYIDNWQSVLKRYYDLSGKKIKFIITGSQSVLLKGKNRESLAGRIFDFYLPPLSFREFLRINGEKVETTLSFDVFSLPYNYSTLSQYDAYYGKIIADLSREYLVTGQFPETRKLPNADQRHEYIVESVIGKIQLDCIRIFNIEKADEFKLITRHLLNNIGSIFELTNIGREIEISKKTVEKYFEYLKESYLFEILYKYHKSLIKRGRILKKLYTPCVNFTCALNHYTENHLDQVPEAFGKIIENSVYIVLKQKYKGTGITESLSFWRQGQKEIDFIVLEKNTQVPIEVKFSRTINVKDLRVMTDYMKQKKLTYGVVITRDEMNRKEVNGQTVYFIPYYVFLFLI